MHTLIVVFLSSVQTVSSLGLTLVNAYKHAMHTIKLVNDSPYGLRPPQGTSPRPNPPIPVQKVPSDGSRVWRLSGLSSSSTSSIASTPGLSGSSDSRSSLPSPDNYAFPTLIFSTTAFSLSARFLSSALILLLSMLVSVFSPFLDRWRSTFFSIVIFPDRKIDSFLMSCTRTSSHPSSLPVSSPAQSAPSSRMATLHKHRQTPARKSRLSSGVCS
jgi:hypothetical protein